MSELELPMLQLTVDQAAGGLATLVTCLMLVLTTKWHGRLSLDTTVGLQKFHRTPTPRIGGLATLAGLVAAYGVSSEAVRQLLGPLLIASLPAFTAGLLEDLTKKASVGVRLLGTIASGVVAWRLTGMALTHTGVPGLDYLLAFVPFSVLFTAVAIGGVANAVNIIDGFNGLAGGVLAILFAALGFISASVGDHALAATCGVLAACSLGFTLVNWPFGKIFLGDGGAYQLGFAVGWISVLLVVRNPEIPAWAPLMVCAYPVLEVAFSMVRKSMREGYNPAVPDRVHLHMLVHRRVVRHLFPTVSRALQNGLTSPFAWLYAGALAVWGCVFAKDTFNLILGLMAAALLYAGAYTRLTRFRWWPFTRSTRQAERAAVSNPGGPNHLTAAVSGPPRLPAIRTGPIAEQGVARLYRGPEITDDMPQVRRFGVLIYGILGLSTFLAVIEPAPFELIAMPLVLASWIRHVLSDSRPYTRSSAALVFLLALFALLQLVPVLGSAQNMLNAAQYAAVTAALIVIGIHLGRLFGTGDKRFTAFVRCYCVAALFSALVAIGSLYFVVSGVTPDWLLFEGRPRAFFKDPNVLGPYLVPAVVAFLYKAAHSRSFAKPFYLLCALVCAVGIVATASRGAWLNLAVTVAAYTILGRTRAMTVALVAITAGVVVTLAMGVGSASAQDLLDLFAGRLQLQDYDADRFMATRQAWELGLQYPLGVGPGDITSRMGLAAMDPHNTYLRVWAENGPAACLLFLVIVVGASASALLAWFNASGRAREAMAVALAVLVGVLINAAVVDALHWRHFWVILGLCVFASHAFSGRLSSHPAIRRLIQP